METEVQVEAPITVCDSPSSATTALTDPLSVALVYPNLLTGIGNVARVTVGPGGTTWNGQLVTESVAQVSNSCSTIPASCSGNTTFTIGVGYQPAVHEGGQVVNVGPLLVGTTNQFFDQYSVSSAQNALASGTCSQTCSQQYFNSCTTPQQILGHAFTYTFTSAAIGGTSVTLVTVSE